MKKSSSITLTLMASMALVSCGQSRRCVNAAGQPAPDMMCTGPVVQPGYHWIILGSRSIFHSSPGTHSSSPSTGGVSRGGIGSTGSSHSSGASGAHGSGS